MDNFKLGELPESLRAWSKFRPVDTDDFTRRAKSLATLLQLPLQKTQDVLAIACGYSGRHELQQILERDDAPGPYDDAIPAEIFGKVADARSIVQFYRHSRLMREVMVLIESLSDRTLLNRDSIACDLELFSTPSAQRAANTEMGKFLGGEAGCSVDGYPYGYRGVLHSRYLAHKHFDEAMLSAVGKGWAPISARDDHMFDPRDQIRSLLRSHAPALFTDMADTTATGLLDLSDLTLGDEPFGDGSPPREMDAWSLNDVDHVLARLLAKRSSEVIDEAALVPLLAAVRSPAPPIIAASPIAAGITGFAERLPLWRLALRYQQAARLGNFMLGPDIVDSEAVRTRIIEAEHEVDGQFRYTSICLRDYDETDLQQEQWTVDATLFVGTTATGPWKAVAALSGTHFVSSKDNTYDPPEIVAIYHDPDPHFKRAWKLLASVYLPVAGYRTYDEWAGGLYENGGGTVSILEPWVAPEYRGTHVSRWLFEGFADAFDDGFGYSLDMFRHKWRDPRIDFEDSEVTVDAGDDLIDGPGVIFIPLPGSKLLGYSVWDSSPVEASTKLVRVNGRRASRPPSWDTNAEAPRGLGPHLLNVAKMVRADIVLYDPDDDAVEEDNEDQG